MNTYRTVDLARMFGVHVNTVRLYERYGLIPKAERTQSGYRIFTELHVEQFKLARAALRDVYKRQGRMRPPYLL